MGIAAGRERSWIKNGRGKKERSSYTPLQLERSSRADEQSRWSSNRGTMGELNGCPSNKPYSQRKNDRNSSSGESYDRT